jgi:hypothetical protein
VLVGVEAETARYSAGDVGSHRTKSSGVALADEAIWDMVSPQSSAADNQMRAISCSPHSSRLQRLDTLKEK